MHKMIKTLRPLRGASLRPEIDKLIDDFGRWDVLRAAFLAVVQPPRRMLEASDLPDRLRRDIGLPPVNVPRDWRMLR
jgi:hypothetical protein